MARNTLLLASCAGLLVLLQFSAAQFPSELQDSSFQGSSIGWGAGTGSGMGGDMGGMRAVPTEAASLSGAGLGGGTAGDMTSNGGVDRMTPTPTDIPTPTGARSGPGTGVAVGGMTPTLTGVRTNSSIRGMSAPSDTGVVDGAIENHDNSPICVTNLPLCQQQCPFPNTYIYMCAAGNGAGGMPLISCECAVPAPPVGQSRQIAQLTLMQWPGVELCNFKSWIVVCTSILNIRVKDSEVTLKGGVDASSNEACGHFKGIVIGPTGNQAAISFPNAQYPVALTSTSPDGLVTFDFSKLGAKDPNGKDWSQCLVTYKITSGTFLNPEVEAAPVQGEETSGAGATLPMAGATLLAVLVSIMGLAWL